MQKTPLPRIEIDPDIRSAATLPARVYADPAYYALQQERVFARSWQFAADSARVKAPGHGFRSRFSRVVSTSRL